MNTVLILFAHPRFEKSRANRALLSALNHENYITVHDLYERYPDFNIDTATERNLLLSHNIVVWHYPFYMFSAPPMIKQWIDLVLEHGWAHGEGGCNMANKIVFNTLTTGGTRNAYGRSGHNRYSLREFLLPFEQTAHLCNMTYLPPFAVQGTYRLTDFQLEEAALLYKQLLQRLAHQPFNIEEIRKHDLLNDWIAHHHRQESS
jgi:glutathione-regulated potassium-efflux system ancillary protein KefG